MKVLFLNPIGQIGGAECVLLQAIRGIRREAPTWRIRTLLLGHGPLVDALQEAGSQVQVVPIPEALARLGDSAGGGVGRPELLRSAAGLVRSPAFLTALRHAIARFSPDLVHSNGIKTHLLSRFAVPAGVPLIWHVHDFYAARPLAGWLLRRCRSRVRAAAAISNAVAAETRRVLPGVRVEVVANAVDLERFSPGPDEGAELDRRAGLPPATPGTVRVGLVATYARWKGHLTVLDAARKLASEAPYLPVRWYIVGGPIYQTAAQFSDAELRAEAAARGLTDRVGFVPFAADPVPVYRSLDVVVHASTQPEPFGLTVAEAMACGRAVVVSAAGGVAELIRPGEDALAFSPGDVAGLAGAVRRLAEDEALRSRLGAAARRAALARFDATDYGRRLGALYRSLLAR